MVFGQASRRHSVCIELTVVTSRRGCLGSQAGIPKRSLGEVEATARGHDRCPLGKLQGPSAADPGNPYYCGQSRSLIPACKRGSHCFSSSSVMGTSWPRHPACLHFPDPSLILRYDDRSPHFLTAQPQVCLGGNSVSGCPCCPGHCVNLYVWHFSF